MKSSEACDAQAPSKIRYNPDTIYARYTPKGKDKSPYRLVLGILLKDRGNNGLDGLQHNDDKTLFLFFADLTGELKI